VAMLIREVMTTRTMMPTTSFKFGALCVQHLYQHFSSPLLFPFPFCVIVFSYFPGKILAYIPSFCINSMCTLYIPTNINLLVMVNLCRSRNIFACFCVATCNFVFVFCSPVCVFVPVFLSFPFLGKYREVHV